MANHGEHGELRDCPDSISSAVLDVATEVHRQLGPGLLESIYERALIIELEGAGIALESQVAVPACYRGRDLGLAFRADLIVEGCLLLERKAVENVSRVHLAQIMNYLKLLQMKRGYLLNFNAPLMKQGIRRISI